MDTPAISAPAFNIPAATIQRWNALDATKPVAVPFTRADIDNLFFAIDYVTRGTVSVQKALIDYTNGRIDDANAANALATLNLAESSNRLRLFMNALMASAEISE